MHTKTLLSLSLLLGALSLASAYKENPHSLYICLWVRFWMQVRHTIFLTNLLPFLVHIWLSIWIFDIKNKNPIPTFVCFLFFSPTYIHLLCLVFFVEYSKMGENAATKNDQHHQVFDVSIDVLAQNGSKCFDDDGRLKRSGKYPQNPVWLLPKPFSFLF